MRGEKATGRDGTDEDAALMLRVRGGDRQAFADLYDRNARSVVNFTYRFVQDLARAEELAQEVFLKLYRSASSYEPKARFKTYLFRIAANHCLNEQRRGEYKIDQASQVSEAGLAACPGAPGDSPDEALMGKDLERALAKALAELPRRERAAFVMCRFEGLSYKDIEFALDATEAAVKSLIHRATVAVAKELALATGHDPPAVARGHYRGMRPGSGPKAHG